MLSCIAPTWDNDALYDLVIADREVEVVPTLTALGPAVKGAYATYESSTTVDATSPPSSILTDPRGTHGEALKGNWDLLRRADYREVRWEALEASGGVCSLCGILSAGEVDHYLPRTPFPEFSILTDNLIPACGRCNKKKSAKHQRSGGGPAYVHPYLHGLPDEPYLACDVEVADAVLITYRVARTPSMSAPLFEVLSNHFKDLDLGALYRDEAISHMDDERNAYYSYYSNGGAGSLAKYLTVAERSSRARQRSIPGVRHHWKPLLLAALAASADFCNGGFMRLGPEFPLDD